jgi:hypothetical protein
MAIGSESVITSVIESFRNRFLPMSTSIITDGHQLSLPASLQEAQISTLPPSLYYIPNFITPAEESVLLDKVISPSPQVTSVPD